MTDNRTPDYWDGWNDAVESIQNLALRAKVPEARVSPAVQETPPAEVCAEAECDLPKDHPYHRVPCRCVTQEFHIHHTFRARPTASGSSETAEAEARRGPRASELDFLWSEVVRMERERNNAVACIAALETAIRGWEAKYGWWDEYDTVRTCGICNEDGAHSDVCPVALLEARSQEPRPTPSAEPVSPPPVELPQDLALANRMLSGLVSKFMTSDRELRELARDLVEPVGDSCDNCGAEDLNECFHHGCAYYPLRALLARLDDKMPVAGEPAEPVEAGVELPDELDLAREPVRPGGTVAIWRSSLGVPWFVPLAVERAIASQAAAEERARYAEGHDMHCEYLHDAPSVDWWQDRMREAREEIARLKRGLYEWGNFADILLRHHRAVYDDVARRAREASASTEAN